MVVTQDRTSLEWIGMLLKELDARTGDSIDNGTKARKRYGYTTLSDYFSGDHGRRFISTGYRELFTRAFEWYRENVCAVAIETVEQRLDVDGFRFPSTQPEASTTDPDAWQIWQDNDLDARSQLAHQEAMICGVSYILVSPFNSERVGPGKRSPRITIERPTEAIVATAPGGSERIVGLKTWYDAVTQRQFVTLYWPDKIEKFQSTGRDWANQHGRGFIADGGWDRRQVPGEAWPLEHTLGVVPLIPLVNRPRLGEGLWAGIEGRSDIADVIPIQDGINFLALNGIVASDKAAFPQKWATGIEIPTVVKDGKTVAAASWQPDIESIISARAPDAKFGNFDVAELKQYDDMIRGKLEEIALVTQIPIANFIAQTGQPASGEAREAAEIGLTKRAERKQRYFGEAWEEGLRLAFRQLGDSERADDTACEAEWRSASVEPSASKVDAISKMRKLGVPLLVLHRLLGFSATDRAKFKEMLIDERAWLNSTPVATTQPEAFPGPDTQADPTAAPVAPAPADANPIDKAGGQVQP